MARLPMSSIQVLEQLDILDAPSTMTSLLLRFNQ
jgi:hypothetical protein